MPTGKGYSMGTLIGRWGTVHRRTDYPVIHPDDMEIVSDMVKEHWYPSFYVAYYCVGKNDGYLISENYDGITFRAKPGGFNAIPDPRFAIGDPVRLKKKPERVRQILLIAHHWWRKETIYIVETSDTSGCVYWFAEQLEQVYA